MLHRRIKRPNLGYKIQFFEDGGMVETQPAPVEVVEAPEKERKEPVEEEIEIPIESAEESEVEVGEKSMFDKILDFVTGSDIPKSVTNWLKKNGDKKIISMKIGRTPVMKYVDILLNIITAGKYNKIKSKIGYDNFFHLYMILELEDSKKYILEKNQTIKISDFEERKKSESISVKIPENLNVDILFEKTYKKYGRNRINIYNALSTNCQRFLLDILTANKLLTVTNKNFIQQNVRELSLKLQKSEKLKIKEITDIGAYIDKFLQFISNGMIRLKKGGIVKKLKLESDSKIVN